MPPPENQNPNPNAPGGANVHPDAAARGDRSRPPPGVSSSTKKGDPQLVPLLFHYRYQNFNAGEVGGVLPEIADQLLKQVVASGDEQVPVCERYDERKHGKTEHGRVVAARRRDAREE